MLEYVCSNTVASSSLLNVFLTTKWSRVENKAKKKRSVTERICIETKDNLLRPQIHSLDFFCAVRTVGGRSAGHRGRPRTSTGLHRRVRTVYRIPRQLERSCALAERSNRGRSVYSSRVVIVPQ